MDCPGENTLLELFEGALQEGAREALLAHLDGCAACRQVVAVLTPGESPRTQTAHPTETSPGSSAKTHQVPACEPERSLVGTSVGEYEVVERIGAGGMGIVYRGRHPVIGKEVAVKVLRGELASAQGQADRLISEARAVNAIANRGVVDIFAQGRLPDGRHYVVMEYLSGQPLDALARDRAPLPAVELLPLLDELLASLTAVHAAGFVHRDLKPSNLFLVQQPDGTRFMKLLDFGLAKQMALAQEGQTRSGVAVGTPAYMAPEQIRGEPASAGTDLYALGVIAFELATGQRPFPQRDRAELMRAHLEEAPPRASALRRSVPAELDALIQRLLAKDVRQRPASAEAVRAELRRMAEDLEVSLAGAPSRTLISRLRGASRGRLAAAVAVLALLVVGAVALDLAVRAPGPEAARVDPAWAAAPVVPARPPPLVMPSAPAAPAEPPLEAPVPEERPAARGAPTARELLARAGRLSRELQRATPRGEEVDPVARLLLKEAEQSAARARTAAERRRVDALLDDLQRKYLRRGAR